MHLKSLKKLVRIVVMKTGFLFGRVVIVDFAVKIFKERAPFVQINVKSNMKIC